MLLPDTMWKLTIHALASCKGQGSYLFSGIDGWRLRKRDIKGFRDNPSPKSRKETIERGLLQIVIKMLRYSSPQLMASVRGPGGEGLSFLQEAGSWEFDRAPQ